MERVRGGTSEDVGVLASVSPAVETYKMKTPETPLAKQSPPESNGEIFILAVEGGAWRISRYMFNEPEQVVDGASMFATRAPAGGEYGSLDSAWFPHE